MPLFSGKEAFIILGLSPIQHSLHHRSQNCTICTLPLTMHPSLLAETPHKALEATSQRPPHPATRINLCNHIVGKECLIVWLDISCMCPVCNHILFDATDEEITERDVVFVYKKLRHLWRKGEILAAIERVLRRKRFEQGWREERAPGVDVQEKGEGDGAAFKGEFWNGSEDGDEEMEEEEAEEGGGIETKEVEEDDENEDEEMEDKENEGEGFDDVEGSEDMEISDSSE